MTLLATVPENMLVTLTGLVDRAAGSLTSARSAAEVLDARDQASFAYDIARKTARLMKAKQAHDDLIAAAYRAQADALEIEAQAKRRLADEYDAAQERGEVSIGRPKTLPDGNTSATVADVGLSSKEIHEARIIRDAETAQPGIVRQTVNEALVKGAEPTKADVKRAALRVVKGEGIAASPRRKPSRAQPVPQSQHDRDLAMISGVWGAACASAQTAFLESIGAEFKLKPEH